MEKSKKLIIGGDSLFAEIAYEYFTYDSEYEVVTFAVEKEYIKKESMFDLPIVPFEELAEHFSPEEHYFYAANVYTQLNRLRTRMYLKAKSRGYKPASYISPRAFVWRNVELGEHCFIFEDNVIQPFVKIGNNVVLWSGNHIGHHSIIKENVFISSHVVVSGVCTIGENGFMGVNATVIDRISIGRDCVIGANALITKNVDDNNLVKGSFGQLSKISAKQFFGIENTG